MPYTHDVDPEYPNNPRPPSTKFMVLAFWLAVILAGLLLCGGAIYLALK